MRDAGAGVMVGLAARPAQLDDLTLGFVTTESTGADAQAAAQLERALLRRHFLASSVRIAACFGSAQEQHATLDAVTTGCDVAIIDASCRAATPEAVAAVGLGVAAESGGVPCAILLREPTLPIARAAAHAAGCPDLALIVIAESDDVTGPGSALLGVERALCADPYLLDGGPTDPDTRNGSVGGEGGVSCAC